MKYKIIIAPSAKSDMREIHRYIKNNLQNTTAADRRMSLIQTKINSLKENPCRYALVLDEYLALKGIRSVAAKNHTVFYRVCEKRKPTVFIVRALYSHRDWATILKADIDDFLDEGDDITTAQHHQYSTPAPPSQSQETAYDKPTNPKTNQAESAKNHQPTSAFEQSHNNTAE